MNSKNITEQYVTNLQILRVYPRRKNFKVLSLMKKKKQSQSHKISRRNVKKTWVASRVDVQLRVNDENL